MNTESIRNLLLQVQQGDIDVAAALEKLRALPYTDLGYARLDNHRALRNGFAEVVLCEGKADAHVAAIMAQLCSGSGPVLGTRASPAQFALVRERVPDARYNELGRTISWAPQPLPKVGGVVLIVSAGTADLPVAEEAAETADIMGNRVERIYDVGVAGLHRLLSHTEQLMAASVVIVVAGMEGALPSVVGGLVRGPVIAVPTSVGYGAAFGGLSALLGMLNSCASGVSVVNIDNGFGAGFAASRINHSR